MLSLDLAKINWLAVVVAAFATFMLGGAWYSALFGKLWQRLHGFSDEHLRAMKAKRPPAVFLGGMVAAYLVLAIVMAILVTSMNLSSVLSGLLLGALLWLGPTSAVAFTGWLASDKVIGTFWLDAAYQLIYLLMMGAILAAWR